MSHWVCERSREPSGEEEESGSKTADPTKFPAKLPCLRVSSWTVTLSGDDMISNVTSGMALAYLLNIPSWSDMNIGNI